MMISIVVINNYYELGPVTLPDDMAQPEVKCVGQVWYAIVCSTLICWSIYVGLFGIWSMINYHPQNKQAGAKADHPWNAPGTGFFHLLSFFTTCLLSSSISPLATLALP